MPPKVRPNPPAKLTGAVHQTAENKALPAGARNLEIPPSSPSAGGPPVTLHVSTPATTKVQHPWMEAIRPHFGKSPSTPVRFVNGIPSVDGQPGPGPGLRDRATLQSLCDATVERLCSQAPSDLSAISQLEYRVAAIGYAYRAVEYFVEKNGEQMTMHNFLSFAKQVMNVEGKPLDQLIGAEMTLMMSCKADDQPIARAAEAARLKFFDHVATELHMFTFVTCTQESVRQLVDCPLPPSLDRNEFESLLVHLVTGTRCRDGDAVSRTLSTLEGNAEFSEMLLENLMRLRDVIGDTRVAPLLDQAIGALTLRLCPDVLAEMILEPEAVVSLAHQAFELVGYAQMTEGVNRNRSNSGPGERVIPADMNMQVQEVGILKALANAGGAFMHESPKGLALGTLLTAHIPMLWRNACLAKVEADLKRAFPNDDVNFDGEPINDLLEFFLSPAQRQIQLPEPQVSGALTWTQDAPQPDAPAPESSTARTGQSGEHQPESAQDGYSMEILKAQWERYKAQKAQRQPAAQGEHSGAQGEVSAEPESKLPTRSDAKKAGSKAGQRITDYPHHLPGRKLARMVRNGRLHDLMNRGASRFSANTKVHGQTKHLPREDPGEIKF